MQTNKERQMTVYVDAVFALNTIINGILLYATARLRGLPVKKWRLCLSACLGGVYAVAVYLPGLAFLQGWLFKILVGVLMVMLAFGAKKEGVATGFVFLFVSVILCGLVFFVVSVLCGKKITGSGVYPVGFSELLLTAGLSYFCGLVLWKRAAIKPQDRLCSVDFQLNGRHFSFTALYDTGNSLRDPVSGQGVDVIWVQTLAATFGQRAVQAVCAGDYPAAMLALAQYRPRLIPYRSVGVCSGLLVAICPQSYFIDGTAQPNRLLALSPTKLNDSGAYTIITGGKIIETEILAKAAANASSSGKAHVYRGKRCSAAAVEGGRGNRSDQKDGTGGRSGEKAADRA